MDNDNSDEPKVIDAEVVNIGEEAAPATGADTLLNLTSLIQNYLGNIARMKKELSEQRQMLEDSFNNDPKFKELADKAKEANKVKLALKKQILNQPQLAELNEKIKESKAELKEAQEILSSYLQDFAKQTGETQFEDANGEINQIVYIAKLVKISSLEK